MAGMVRTVSGAKALVVSESSSLLDHVLCNIAIEPLDFMSGHHRHHDSRRSRSATKKLAR